MRIPRKLILPSQTAVFPPANGSKPICVIAIHAGKLRPRQRIIEEDLARELKVSRGPVREATAAPERDGLVVTTSRRGTFIRDISLTEIDVIFRMRAKLEGLCVRYMRENPVSTDPAALLGAGR